MFNMPIDYSEILSDETIFNKKKLEVFRRNERRCVSENLLRMQKKNELWESIDHNKYDKNSINFDELLDNPDYSIESLRWDVIYAKNNNQYYKDMENMFQYEKSLETDSEYDDMEYNGYSDEDETE